MLNMHEVLSKIKHCTYRQCSARGCWLVDRDNLAKVARIVFYRLDLSSSLKNIYKNVFGLAVGALEIVSLIFLEILSCS